MAGHSQFANIKHRKGAQDAKRAKIFTKLIREIIVAAKQGLPDPEFNPRLRSAITAARKENLPKDRIESAIKSAIGNTAGDNYEEVLYEGYGPCGTALIVHSLTNNRNRTASEIRHAFSKHNGNLGESGSVLYLFDHVGLIVYKAADNFTYDDFFDAALELNATNIENISQKNDNGDIENLYNVICDVQDFGKIRDGLYEKFSDHEMARLSYQAKDSIKISDSASKEKVISLIEALEENDDVQYVEGNFIFEDTNDCN